MRTFRMLYRGSIIGAVLPALLLKRAVGEVRIILAILVFLSAIACGVSCLIYKRLPANEKEEIKFSGVSILSVHPYISFSILVLWSIILTAISFFPSILDTAFSLFLLLFLLLISIMAYVIKYHNYKMKKSKSPVVHKKGRHRRK